MTRSLAYSQDFQYQLDFLERMRDRGQEVVAPGKMPADMPIVGKITTIDVRRRRVYIKNGQREGWYHMQSVKKY